MTLTRKNYWELAMKGGTIIGLSLIVIAILRFFIPGPGIIFTILNVGVFAYLIYHFTKKAADKSNPEEGFTFGRCVGFTVCMMLFVGTLMGIYTYVFNNFINPDAVEEAVATTIDTMENTGLLSYSDSDAYYDLMMGAQRNPIVLIFAGILTYVIYGAIVGLVTSALAKKDPNPFADTDNH